MRLGKLAIVVGVCMLLTSPAAGQAPGGFGGRGFGGGLAGMVGQSKQLQDELKMDKEQVEKLTGALATVREDLRDDLAKLRDRNTRQEERAEITKKLNEANAKAVSSVLRSEQLKRLHQIENQQAGVGMFAKEEVLKALKLSDVQKESIDTINKDLQKDTRELSGEGRRGQRGRGGFDPEAMKKLQALQKEAKDNILKVLNDDQKSTLNDLTGAPFELRREGFGVGGAGGFAGRTQPGQILPQSLQDTLKLTAEQKKQLEELQKQVDSGLDKILTDEQKKQLKDVQERGRGGPGRPGGRRGQNAPRRTAE